MMNGRQLWFELFVVSWKLIPKCIVQQNKVLLVTLVFMLQALYTQTNVKILVTDDTSYSIVNIEQNINCSPAILQR